MTARVLVPIGLFLAFVPPGAPHLLAHGRALWQGGDGVTAAVLGDLAFHAAWLVVALGALVITVRGGGGPAPAGASEDG